ncbi:capsular exopolysaccharide family [Clostridium collagenovorans DSM 3089]|uniref:non-specific protein-tyrosine kinase n=1 Tax=Clostridium collagenovorans DSM 3089 TaxID=1121306 RepID=A0A1M5X3M9_9CLOT|nr:CpsD/CapB family tyrosine-protein kinase [Clostridium collagenovorans]SHH94430.1 capsular exopolysaccharide family [Clostridium collagenovorans DSM 3089]
MNNLIIKDKPQSLSAEAFRTLKTNIDFFNFDNKLKTLAITSATPGEGKSTSIANLAIAFAQAGKRVVLVDCDFRRPTVHKTFNLSNSKGITDMLIAKSLDLDFTTFSGTENLYILPCGVKPPNPAELLSSRKMELLIESLKAKFDLVLLDIPPVLPVADSRIICGKVDGVILLCTYGKTQKEDILRCKHELTKINAKLIGSVLNKIPEREHKYGYYYNNESASKGLRFRKKLKRKKH